MLARLFHCLFLIITAALSAHAGIVQTNTGQWPALNHDSQHTGISPVAAAPLQRILWKTPIDYARAYSGNDLFIHYGSPLLTGSGMIVYPVKTSRAGHFGVVARRTRDGARLWQHSTDYLLPLHDWVPSCGITFSPSNQRFYFPAAGGTVLYRPNPEAKIASVKRACFYGLDKYLAHRSDLNARVRINTPLTSDATGNIFFGFEVTGSTAYPGLQSGLARLTPDGSGSWVTATSATGDQSISKIAMNCAPALSKDGQTLYVAANYGTWAGGYLLALDSHTLATKATVLLRDVATPGNSANVIDDSSASPTVGPDGDVYFGVLENPTNSHHNRGWMLHFDQSLTQVKIPGSFGWDDTPSIVPAAAVPAYTGTSSYLLLTKYNNYADPGSNGDGVNRMAILDPNASMTDPYSGAAAVMKEVITIKGVTPDAKFINQYPNAVREWCVNAVAVDPASKCAIVNSEDGKVYRWDFTTNSLTETVKLNNGIGEAYTPSIIGADGTSYLISNGTIYAVGPSLR